MGGASDPARPTGGVGDGRVTFSYTHGGAPLWDTLDPGDPRSGYEQLVPSELAARIRAWNERMMRDYDPEASGDPFPSQQIRAELDREYVTLSRELREVGVDADLDLWW